MRWTLPMICAAALFAFACGSSDPELVPVIGVAEELAPLTGEWSGTYESRNTGRSGSITFHLTDDPKGAHGDVLFIAPQEYVRHEQVPPQQFHGATVLKIEFVRVAAGEISGRIAPYPDPAIDGGMLETHFAGHLVGDRIEGTFVTYADHGVAPQRGTWTVTRRVVSARR